MHRAISVDETAQGARYGQLLTLIHGTLCAQNQISHFYREKLKKKHFNSIFKFTFRRWMMTLLPMDRHIDAITCSCAQKQQRVHSTHH